MRETWRRRPGFESLESMTLLSGLAGAAVPNPIHLTGSISGVYKPTLPDVHGAGSISPLGHVKVVGQLSSWPAVGPLDYVSLTLTTKTGKTFVDAQNDLSLTATHDGEVFVDTYTISGGTKAYQGETGSGTVLIRLTGSQWSGKFTAVFS